MVAGAKAVVGGGAVVVGGGGLDVAKGSDVYSALIPAVPPLLGLIW